jgi:type I restriction enzyme, S subunit
MNDWHKFKLKELASLKTGKLDSNAANTEGKYPFFTCSQETYYIDDYAFDTTAILLGGNNAAGIFPLKFYSGKFNCYQRTYVIEPISEKCSLKFLYYSLYLKLDFLRSLSIGATTKFLTKRVLDDLEIYLPDFLIQQKIAAILSRYDDLIENNLKQIKLLEEMAQITYQEWFVRLKFPNHENTPMDEETGLPIGWSEETITSISFINANSLSTKTAPETIKYIDIASAGTGFYSEPQLFSFAEAPSRARRKLNFGDTIFSTVRPNQKTYSLILDDPLLVASTGFAVLTPKIEDTFPFVYLSVANQNFVDKTVAVAGGAAYPAINQNDFEKIKIIKPDDELIKQFSAKMINNFLVKSALTKQNQLLKEARDILLPRLMTGKITVGADLSAQCE